MVLQVRDEAGHIENPAPHMLRELTTLNHLRHLKISTNALNQASSALSTIQLKHLIRLPHLQSLFLESKATPGSPEVDLSPLRELPHLDTLCMNGNCIKTLDVFTSGFTSLRVLLLMNSSHANRPEPLLALPSLRRLILNRSTHAHPALEHPRKGLSVELVEPHPSVYEVISRRYFSLPD
jgi:hypothetical protein